MALLQGGLADSLPLPAVDVLIVDDNESVRTSFNEIIMASGYSTLTAEDGVAALAVLQSATVGVMLLDVRMPHLGGLALLDTIADPPPVVLLTAVPQQVLEYPPEKVVGYLQKPVNPGHLLDVVESVIGRPNES